jgi:protein-L-isoaspartate(D-aspartate) O-methyltransferase
VQSVLFAPTRQEKIEEMLRTIEAECRWTAGLTGVAAVRPAILEAMARVPRDAFVPPTMQPNAFANSALPIGEGQTISQPFIVALMTELLHPAPPQTVLEVGTGSGYQAAVLAQLVERVCSIEIVPALSRQAAERLARLGCENVELRSGDGYRGWPERAPFDGIVVTAAAPHVPPPLLEQLRPGGRLVIPVGHPWGPQQLVLVEKDVRGVCHPRDVLGVAFVPLTGGREREEKSS